jgi:AcrR family transcriptional regulator
MAQDDAKMRVSELAGRSGVPVSTIKFYIRKGLLPGPMKTGATQGFYTRKHLDRLKLIQKIRKEGSLPIEKIREITQMIDASAEREKREKESAPSEHKAEIVRTAISVFRGKGYETVTIADIVDAARIGRSTFYKNFRNKKDLFIECIREIVNREGIPEDVGEAGETEGSALFDRSAEAYFLGSPLWSDMIKMLRAAAVNDPAEFEGTLEEALQLKIEVFKKRIKRSVQKGFMREVNPTLLAVMLLAIQDYCSAYVAKGQFQETPESIFEGVKDILLNGVRTRG